MTTYPVGPYPPAVPTTSGTLITVDRFLQDPPRVTRALQDLTSQRFIADRVMGPGPTAVGGAVLYDQVLGQELYLDQDVAAIAPGAEFPELTESGPAGGVAKTLKWGGSTFLTYEEIDRDRRDVLNRRLTKLRNTVVRKVNLVTLAVIKAAPILTQAASASWATASTKIGKDVSTAQTTVDVLDMGYVLTDAYVSPITLNNLVNNDSVQKMVYASGGRITPPQTQNPTEPRMRGFLGLDWYATNRVDDDEALLFSGQQAGSVSDERPLYTRVVDQQERERRLIMGARLCVPFVTDPKSVLRITGIK